MEIITLIFAILLIGLLLYVVNVFVPDHRIKNVFNIVVLVIVVIWLLQVTGIIGSLREFRLR